MASTQTLMGLGMPGPLANYEGFTKSTLVTTGTTGATAAPIRSNFVVLTTASSQTGAILPVSASVGDFFYVTNPASTTGIVYPDTGGTLNGGATDAGQNLAQNKTALYIKVASLTWVSILTG